MAVGDPINKIDPSGESDLNLFNRYEDPSLWSKSERIKHIDGLYSITGHGYSTGEVSDDAFGHGDLNPSELYSLIRDNNYVQGTTIFLGSCFGANGAMAQALAVKAGADVIATDAYLMYHRIGSDGDVRLTANSQIDGKGEQMHFYRFDTQGRGTAYTSAKFDSETGKLTLQRAPETGSRIGSHDVVCIDKGKCK